MLPSQAHAVIMRACKDWAFVQTGGCICSCHAQHLAPWLQRAVNTSGGRCLAGATRSRLHLAPFAQSHCLTPLALLVCNPALGILPPAHTCSVAGICVHSSCAPLLLSCTEDGLGTAPVLSQHTRLYFKIGLCFTDDRSEQPSLLLEFDPVRAGRAASAKRKARF